MGNVNVCSFSIPIEVDMSGCWNCKPWPAKYSKYVCKLEENLHNLKVAVEEIKEWRDDVMTRVNIAEESQQMKRLKQVEGWLLRVEAMETEVNELIVESTRELKEKCPSGCCPTNCMSSYTLGKKVVRAKDNVASLKCKGVFEEVAYRLPSAPVDERPSQLTVGLEPMFDEVWSYIEDQQARIVGLYGIGGVGKTTLLTEINNKLFNTPLGFDVVIWVSVSRNQDLNNVQDDIGKKLGLHNEEWGSKRREDKSIDIFGVLKKKKFMLLLDDIWERLDLLKVGVPVPNTQNKSKVVFTTRFEDVCCHMEADTKIKVKFLAPEKAWDLFRKTVGEATLNLNPELCELARSVARECNGLPLALITIGRAMACKTTSQDWLHERQVLKKFAAEFFAARNVEDSSETTKSTSPPPPSSAPVYTSTTAEAPDLNGAVSTSSLGISKPVSSSESIQTLLDKAADEGLVRLQSPRVGSFRRSRTIKGKLAPPSCKEKQIVKERRVLCHIEQLGGEIPIKSDISGEVIKILRDDGGITCYNCRKKGHIARNCPKPMAPRPMRMTCYNCNEPGHISTNCPRQRRQNPASRGRPVRAPTHVIVPVQEVARVHAVVPAQAGIEATIRKTLAGIDN